MDGFREFFNLSEVHYEDAYHKSFLEFRKKYIKFKNKSNLFVNFTNFANDVTLRNPHPKTNHSDPVGVYAYPLKYVIDYPGDIKYGNSAKYLRVIENLGKMDTVWLQYMYRWQAENYLSKAGLNPKDMDRIQKIKKHKSNKSQIGKQFFDCIQIDLSKTTTVDGWGKINYHMRSSKEQTDLLLKMGIDVVIDTAKNASMAIVNAHEPEQAIFLTRHSFKVKEIFTIGQDERFMVSTTPDKSLRRKLASEILAAMGDKIKEAIEDNLDDSTFFSVKGQKLNVAFKHIITKQMMDRPMGLMKKHKEFKWDNNHETVLTITGPNGTLKRKYFSDDKFKNIVPDFVDNYNRSEKDPNHLPHTKKRHEDELKREKERIIDDQIEKNRIEQQKNNEKDAPRLQSVFDRYGINYKVDNTTNYSNKINHIGRGYSKFLRNTNQTINQQSLNEFWDSWAEEYNKLNKDGKGLYADIFPGLHNDPMNIAIRQLFNNAVLNKVVNGESLRYAYEQILFSSYD